MEKKKRPIKPEFWSPPVYDPDETGYPGTYTKADIRALQALEQGDADEAEQKRAFHWIIHHACLTYDEPFRPGQPDVVNYMLGRRSVGLAIISITKRKPEVLDKKGD